MGFTASLERWRLRTRRRPSDHHLWLDCGLYAFPCADEPAAGGHCDGASTSPTKSCLIGVLALCPVLFADKFSFDERVEIERGLTAEYATAK